MKSSFMGGGKDRPEMSFRCVDVGAGNEKRSAPPSLGTGEKPSVK